MTDPTELIARLENGFFYTQSGEASDVPDQAAAMLRTLAAERDAALAPKPAAPTGETVRVQIPVHLMRHSSTLLIECQGTSGKMTDFAPASTGFPIGYITADIPIPQPAEITGTVEKPE